METGHTRSKEKTNANLHGLTLNLLMNLAYIMSLASSIYLAKYEQSRINLQPVILVVYAIVVS